MTTTKPRWTRVLNGWYSLNLGANSAELIQDMGAWTVKVNDVTVGMVATLAGAKAVALAAM